MFHTDTQPYPKTRSSPLVGAVVWLKHNALFLVVFASFALNLVLGAGYVLYWSKPLSPVRTPEERTQVYSQYLPENAREEYRDRINANLGVILDLHKKIRMERQTIAELLARDSVDRAELLAHFKTIRGLNQQVGSIYQETLVNMEASLPLEERQQSHHLIMQMLKRDQPATQ